MSAKRIDFHGRLDGRTPLGDGSVRFTARLTRTGVFDYGDHKELRVPEEVFSKEALDSFKGIVVTEGHQGWVDATNWRHFAIGHVGDDVHQDGDFVVASLVIRDAKVLSKIDAKELAEISMGYAVDLEPKKGKTDAGEEYDAIQRNIRGNHAALGPANWGRAGSEVRLLDGKAFDAPAYAPATMKTAEQLQKELEASNAERDAACKERDDAKTELDAAKKRADQLEAERDAAKSDLAKARTDADPAKIDERVNARIAIVDAARTVLGKDFDAKGKSDREVREAALKKIDEKADFAGKSDAYVEARFDLAIESAKGEQKALGSVNETTNTPAPAAKGRLDEALESAAKESAELSKAGPPPCASAVRK